MVTLREGCPRKDCNREGQEQPHPIRGTFKVQVGLCRHQVPAPGDITGRGASFARPGFVEVSEWSGDYSALPSRLYFQMGIR